MIATANCGIVIYKEVKGKQTIEGIYLLGVLCLAHSWLEIKHVSPH